MGKAQREKAYADADAERAAKKAKMAAK